MKNFTRSDLLFSLCGLNCGLCVMKLGGHCPGCGGGEGNQACSIAKCSIEHGGYNYCFECDEYPCAKYDNATRFDSFITHKNQLVDMRKAQLNLPAYHNMLTEKYDILNHLLNNYNDGRHKTFFALSVNLLELSDLKFLIDKIESSTPKNISQKEKTSIAKRHFLEMAKLRDIILKLRKK